MSLAKLIKEMRADFTKDMSPQNPILKLCQAAEVMRSFITENCCCNSSNERFKVTCICCDVIAKADEICKGVEGEKYAF